ncbi:MAG: GNAT family N-acetyltransferase, partial [Firmicutes bacterium]|nr:GNAT family N-acetyltransferase [Bacillota bacterium]
IVMTSTQADEEGQHFYRKLGYRDIGGFVLPGEPLELIMIKELV